MGNKIRLLVIAFLATFIVISVSSAGVIEDKYINNTKINESSIQYNPTGGLVDNVNTVGTSLLTTVKVVFEGVLFVFMIIVGIQMVISLGSDEDSLNNSKRQIRYSLVALIFINIPGSIYSLIYNDNPASIGYVGSSTWVTDGSSTTNLFLNYYNFGSFLGINGSGFSNNLVGLLQVLIFGIAVIMIVISGIKIITARGKEELITEGKNKIIFSIIGIVLVGFISAWRNVVFNGKISDGANFFSTLANLFLFFAGPVAIFFLALAGYYLITSVGDEERIKKAKTIVINTVIATLILLASYSFLGDLANL